MDSVFTTNQSHHDYVPPEVKVRIHPETLSESLEEKSTSTLGATSSGEKNVTSTAPKTQQHFTIIIRAMRKLYYFANAYYPMFQPYFAEFVGTFLFVFLGIGSVSAIVLVGALKGVWEMGIVWGISLAISIYCTASISGAHLNPAISVTMARCGLYIISQFLGGLLAGAVNLSVWKDFITEFERENNLVRDILGVRDQPCTTPHIFSPWLAFSVEMFGTGILTFLAFAVTDPSNKSITRKELAPLIIGLTLTLLICLFAPLTQACFNPARDLGPRFIAALAGWREIALSPSTSWVYTIAPLLGGPCGAAIYLFGLERRITDDSVVLD
ncbi:aquaporin-like protein [Chytridium lagenaria]|nr:aquaporin-like protein [Chytridium lagenaria]